MTRPSHRPSSDDPNYEASLQKLAKRRLRQFLVEGEINLITRRTEAV
jgi:hypothetical protein